MAAVSDFRALNRGSNITLMTRKNIRLYIMSQVKLDRIQKKSVSLTDKTMLKIMEKENV